MRALYMLWYGASLDEATSNSEKIKSVGRQVGRKAGRQADKNSIDLKRNCNNLLEALRVIVKALLGLVIPTNTAGVEFV